MQKLSVDLMLPLDSRNVLSTSAARSSATADPLKNFVSGKTKTIQSIQHVTLNMVAVVTSKGPAVEMEAA